MRTDPNLSAKMVGEGLIIVSVVIPTFNHGKFVIDTLESVFSQSVNDIEIIVVNDGSTDGTAEVLRPYFEAGRIHYIEQVNAGQAAARNRGAAEARGEYIAFLDDDDLWPPDKLEWQIELASRSPEAVGVYGFCESFPTAEHCRPLTEQPGGLIRDQLLAGNWIISPGQTLLRRDAIRQVGGFDEAIRGADDWDMLIRLAAVGRFIYGDRLALRYRVHAANASRDAWAMFRGARQVQRKHLGVVPGFRRWKEWIKLRNQVGRHYARLLLEQSGKCEYSSMIGLRKWLQIAFMDPRGAIATITKRA